MPKRKGQAVMVELTFWGYIPKNSLKKLKNEREIINFSIDKNNVLMYNIVGEWCGYDNIQLFCKINKAREELLTNIMLQILG